MYFINNISTEAGNGHAQVKQSKAKTCNGRRHAKKLLPVRTGLVAKSITSPQMFRYSMT